MVLELEMMHSHLQPGEFRDVDAPGGNIKDQFMTLPFKGPDATLLQLMGVVVSAGQRFASIADSQVGDMNQAAAVGTTVALLGAWFTCNVSDTQKIICRIKTRIQIISRSI